MFSVVSPAVTLLPHFYPRVRTLKVGYSIAYVSPCPWLRNTWKELAFQKLMCRWIRLLSQTDFQLALCLYFAEHLYRFCMFQLSAAYHWQKFTYFSRSFETMLPRLQLMHECTEYILLHEQRISNANETQLLILALKGIICNNDHNIWETFDATKWKDMYKLQCRKIVQRPK